MKVNLVKKTTIEEYSQHNPFSRDPFRDWLLNLQDADWKTPADIKKVYPSADLLGNGTNRVVFDIGGNNYRMICKYWFGQTRVHLYIKWIGTHALYTKLCRQGKQYDINNLYD
jgi:mRNA interferase HigB